MANNMDIKNTTHSQEELKKRNKEYLSINQNVRDNKRLKAPKLHEKIYFHIYEMSLVLTVGSIFLPFIVCSYFGVALIYALLITSALLFVVFYTRYKLNKFAEKRGISLKSLLDKISPEERRGPIS